MAADHPSRRVARSRSALLGMVVSALALSIAVDAAAGDPPAAVDSLEKAGARLTRDDDGFVIEARFKGPHVDPVAVESLAGFSRLRSLVVAGTDAGDDLLPTMGRLTALRNLDLRDCPVTNRGLPAVAGMKDLAALRLSGKSGATTVDDEGLAALAALPALRTLMLDHLWVGGDGLSALAPRGILEELTLAQTLVRDDDMTIVARFPKLRRLRLARTSVTGEGLARLAALRSLEDLDVSESVQLDDAALEQIGRLPALRKLNLWRVPIGDAGVTHLAGLSKLEWLNLDNTQLTDAGLESLAGMRKLRSLFIGSTAISSAGLERLAGLEALRELSLQRTGVDAAAVERLQRRLPDVKVSLAEPVDE